MTTFSDRAYSPGDIIHRLDRFCDVARQIQSGLAGNAFVWNGTEGDYNVGWAEQMGLHLVTRTWLDKHNYRLKRGAKPVGSRYYSAPISGQRALYVLECQTHKKE